MTWIVLTLALALVGLAFLVPALPKATKGALLSRLRRWNRDARPHQLVRYVPVLSLLNQSRPGRILEVGSGPSGITLLRPSLRIVGCDLAFYRAPDAGVTAVGGSVLELPFRDGSFDAVVSVEMLGEIAPADRARALEEMVRVAGRRAIVVTPWGEPGDRLHRDLYRWVVGRGHTAPGWLVHLQSVPSPKEDVLDSLRRRNDLRVTVLPGLGRVPLWWLLRLEDRFVSGVPLQLFVPLLRPLLRAGRCGLRWGESYEKVLVLERNRAGALPAPGRSS